MYATTCIGYKGMSQITTNLSYYHKDPNSGADMTWDNLLPHAYVCMGMLSSTQSITVIV